MNGITKQYTVKLGMILNELSPSPSGQINTDYFNIVGMKTLFIKSVDVMKKSKDTVNNQSTLADKQNLIARLATMGITHVAISVPMDTNVQMKAAGNTPSPLSIEGETRQWCKVIHDAGLNVLHRGTFSGMEAIYSFPIAKEGSGAFIPVGTVNSAPTDNESTWMGRIRRYIMVNVGDANWKNGDIFAPIPEPTSQAFNGNNFWLSTGAGSQANFASFFIVAHAVADAAFASMGKKITFMTCNNYSEVRSGWIPQSLFADQGIVAFDYYGQYQATGANSQADYITDLNELYEIRGLPLFQGEWGDISGEAIPTPANIAARLTYLVEFYKQYRDNLVKRNILTGFNYWGGWEAQNTSILLKTGSDYFLNARGKILAKFLNFDDGYTTAPTVTSGTTDDNYTFADQ